MFFSSYFSSFSNLPYISCHTILDLFALKATISLLETVGPFYDWHSCYFNMTWKCQVGRAGAVRIGSLSASGKPVEKELRVWTLTCASIFHEAFREECSVSCVV